MWLPYVLTVTITHVNTYTTHTHTSQYRWLWVLENKFRGQLVRYVKKDGPQTSLGKTEILRSTTLEISELDVAEVRVRF